MRSNSQQKRVLFSLLCLLLACLTLCSCGSLDSCAAGCTPLQLLWEPRLADNESSSGSPVIEHSLSADDVTLQLEQHFAPIEAMLQTANRTNNLFSLAYTLDNEDGKHYLRSRIVCSSGGEIVLPDIYIPYSGAAAIPDWSVPVITDSDLLCAGLELTANGIEVNWEKMSLPIRPAEMYSLYTDYYRKVSGIEPDISRFSADTGYDELFMQSMVLGMCDSEFIFDYKSADRYDLLTASAGLLSSMYYDACGVGSNGFSSYELLRCLDTYVRSGIFSGENWDSSAQLISRLCAMRLGEMSSAECVMPATRQQIAAELVDIYEIMFGTIYPGEFSYNVIEDTEDTDCIKAYDVGLLNSFPSASVLSPDYTPGYYLLPGFVSDFLTVSLYETDSQLDDSYITYGDALIGLSAVDICVRRAGICTEPPVVVNNSRDYNWYYTQHGTGFYSSVNCMPTIAMMATKWYDQTTTVTIQEMRQRYLPDYEGGWYTWQVSECLDTNGVPNELYDLSEDKLPFLDEGKIILSQMSEAAASQSGHCFLIYGYWKRGDSIKYYVHDPDVYNGIDDYGQRPGYAMVLDGRYCDWIIDRIAFSYIVVG